MIDADGKLMYQSPAALKMLGYTPEEAFGKSGVDFFHPDEQSDVLARLKNAIQNPGVPIFRRGRMRHKKGHYIWTEGTTTNLLDDENVKAFVGNFHDITDIIEKQQQIEFDQNNLNAIINNTHDLMWSVDKEYNLITCNSVFDDAAIAATGNKIAKGYNVLSMHTNIEQKEYWKKLYENALSGKIFVTTEQDTKSHLWAEISFYPIRQGEEIIGTACYSHNITERKKTEEKIRRSKINLKAIFEHSSENLMLTDVDGVLLTFNDNAQKTNLLTCRYHMETGHNILEYIAEERKTLFETYLAKAAGGESIRYDQSFTDLEGHFHCYDFAINPVKEDGIVTGICFNGRDITEKKLASEKIEKNEQRLELERKKFSDLFVQAPSCICMLKGEDFVYEMANPLYLKLTGKNSDIIGKKAAEVFPELVQQGFVDLLMNVYKTGNPFSANEQFIQIDIDGNGVLTDNYMNFVYQPYRNSENKIEGIFFFANLVTEQVLARKKIEQGEKHFRALVENAEDIISLADEKGNLVYISPAIEKITGYSIEEMLGKPYASIIHPDHLKESTALFAKLAANPGTLIRKTTCFVHKNGENVWVEGAATNLLHDENVNGLISNLRDVTERKHAETKIMHANRLYAILSGINQTIVHAPDEQAVFRKACEIATEVGEFKMAWVGLIDKENGTISIAEGSGIPAEDLPMFTKVVYNTYGPQYNVVNTGTSFISNEVENENQNSVWKQLAKNRGMNSRMVLPIKKAGNIIATFNLYATEKNFFDQQEIALLEEIARDISFAIDVFEKEKKRKEIEEKVKQSELQLQQAQSIAHFGSWNYNFQTGKTEWTLEACRIYGLSPEENKQTPEFTLSFIHPDDIEDVTKRISEAEKTFSSFTLNHRIIARDGNVKHIYSAVHYDLNADGIPTRIYGIIHDVTEMKEAEEKLINANRLYAFISSINQTIVQVNNEATLFAEACRIAIEIGKFNLGWISIPDKITRRLNVVAHCNATEQDLEILNSLEYDSQGPIATVLETGNLFVINDFEQEAPTEGFKKYAALRGFRSCIVLPIMKEGTTIGAYNLISSKANLFDEEEIRLLKEATGDISFALSVFEKEKHRKEMESKVLQSELRLKEAQSIAHLGSWDIDFATGNVEWSQEAYNIYGINNYEDKHTYESWLSFVHPDDLEHVKKESMKGSDSFDSVAFHHRIVKPDGSIRHVYSQAQYKFDQYGKPTGLNGAVHDITDMKAAEEALAHSEANLRLIMDLVPQAVFAKDYNGKFVFSNKSFAALYGLTPKDMINKSISDIIPIKSQEGYFHELDKEVIRSGKTKKIPEHSLVDCEGNLRLFSTTKVPFIFAGTNEKAVLGVTMEITEQKQADAERLKMLSDLVQRNKDLEQFSYIISHNLRAPVANILGLSNLLDTIELENEEERELITNLSFSTKKLDEVIMDLNYILQIKHKESKKKEIILFSELLQDIKLSIDNVIREEKVFIESDFNAIDELYTVKSYLYSIFFNLISNSIKYRRPEVSPLIAISSNRVNNKLQLVFKDNGLGIDLDKRGDQIFGLYKRFHNHVEGKGMGLYMVKTQVEALGGNVTINSEVNKGTEFKIELDIY